MIRRIITASSLAAALALGAAQGALAASDTAAGSTIRADQMRANKVIGATVYDRENQDVGSVKDLILDKSGKVAEVVLSYGTTAGMGGKYVAVPFSNLKFDHDRLTLDDTKAQLDKMAAYRLEDSNTGSGESSVPATGGHATGSVAPGTAGSGSAAGSAAQHKAP